MEEQVQADERRARATRDITDRKKAEEELRASEEWHHAVFEGSRDAIFITEASSRFADVNEAAEILTGYSKEELREMKIPDIHDVTDLHAYDSFFERIMEGESISSESYILRKDGKKVPTEFSNRRIIIRGIPYMHSVARDITERKHAEEALRRSEDKYRQLIENVGAPVTYFEINGEVLLMNTIAAQALGGKPEDFVGKNITDLFPADEADKYLKRFSEISKTGQGGEFEDLVELPSGNQWFGSNLQPVRDRDENIFAIQIISYDITERKKAEEELVRLSNAVKRSTDSIVISDLDGKIIDVNEATLKMYGTEDKGDLIGKNSLDLIAPEDREKALAGLKEALEEGYVTGREYHIVVKDGGRILVEMNSAIIKDVDGKPIGFVGISRDITERKKAEDALRKSENKSRTLLENLPHKIFFKDKNSVFISCNENFARDLKIKSDEITGKTDYDFHPKKLAEKYRADDKEIMESGKTEEIEEEYLLDGQKVFVHTVKTPVKDENGNVVGVLGIFRDITERKRMEEELKSSEERLRILFEYAPDTIFVYDLKGNVIDVNKGVERLIDYRREEIIGKNFAGLKLLPPSQIPKVTASLTRAVQGQAREPTELTLIRKDGGQVEVEIMSYIVEIKDQQVILGIARDITERKRMEEKLREYAENLEKLVEERTRELKEAQERLLRVERLAAIGETAAMVGHDLRNPLQVILNTLYLARQKLGSLNIKEREALENQGFFPLYKRIGGQVEYMNKIVSDLQDYARPLKPKLVETSLRQLIDGTLSSVKVPENVKVSEAVEEDFPKLMVDPELMKRAFINLVTNALQAMPSGGRLAIGASRTEETASISVEDTGVGIPEENLPMLFQPLFTTKPKGQGFGLPVSKRIVEAHGGAITVESQVGRGSTFMVHIPLERR